MKFFFFTFLITTPGFSFNSLILAESLVSCASVYFHLHPYTTLNLVYNALKNFAKEGKKHLKIHVTIVQVKIKTIYLFGFGPGC